MINKNRMVFILRNGINHNPLTFNQNRTDLKIASNFFKLYSNMFPDACEVQIYSTKKYYFFKNDKKTII